MIGEFDLFGEPVRPSAVKAGRPRHAPSDATRRAVRAMAADRRSQDQIAAAIGITGPTLRMHYHEELGSSSQVWKRRTPLGGSNDDE